MSRSKLFMLGTAILAALVMVIPVASASASANGGTTGTTKTADATILSLDFASAPQTFQYYVDVSSATKPLKVSTEDCCIAGDHWGVVVEDLNGGNPPVGTSPKAVTKCGTGSITAFTGSASVKNPSSTSFNGRALAIVYYCRGINQFDAGMSVKFDSDGAITVTPRAAGGP
jgi:hypothetical protein